MEIWQVYCSSKWAKNLSKSSWEMFWWLALGCSKRYLIVINVYRFVDGSCLSTIAVKPPTLDVWRRLVWTQTTTGIQMQACRLSFWNRIRKIHYLRSTASQGSCCGDMSSSPKGRARLRIREWTCARCGTRHDRDINASRNILAIGLDRLVAGIPFTLGRGGNQQTKGRVIQILPSQYY